MQHAKHFLIGALLLIGGGLGFAYADVYNSLNYQILDPVISASGYAPFICFSTKSLYLFGVET